MYIASVERVIAKHGIPEAKANGMRQTAAELVRKHAEELAYRTRHLNELVAELTAFKDWPEMAIAMVGGYCPTLNGSKATDWKYARLARICVQAGFKVFRGGKVLGESYYEIAE